MKAKIVSNRSFAVGKVEKQVFGSFIEHLGRAVYGGMYDASAPSADGQGFRGDVIEAIRNMGVTAVRYPGGNFVSGYRWEDGVGKRENRPAKKEYAWSSLETNEIGTDEFLAWCEKTGVEPVLAVNLGSRGAEDAVNYFEYCNAASGKYAEMRAQNGHPAPYGVKTWCLGNEMDGFWQIGHKPAAEYGRLADKTAKLLRARDPELKLIVCGSSNRDMDSYGVWEQTVLEQCYESIDYISLHTYYGNRSGDTADFLAKPLDMAAFIDEVISICDAVKAQKRSEKQIDLSFDEWNVWYHSNGQDEKIEKWQVAPPLLEDIYNFEDALVTASMLMCILRRCDRVKIGCLAQLVNVIAPIFTKTGGGMFRQTIYFPFLELAALSEGVVRKLHVESPLYDTRKHKNVPCLDAVAGEKDGKLYLFAVNRSLTEDMELAFETPGEHWELTECRELYHDDLKAVNGFHGEPVHMREKPLCKELLLKKHSFNVFVFEEKN